MADLTFLTRPAAAATQKSGPLSRRSIQMSPGKLLTAPTRARSSVPKRKTHSIVRDLNQFGCDSPSWTIGASRHPPKPPPDFPSPCHYDIPSDTFQPSRAKTIGDRQWPDYRTVTSNIDLPDLHIFPELAKKTFHQLDGTSYIPRSCSPGPSYGPDDYRPRFIYTAHIIGSRYRPTMSEWAESPAPWTYQPGDAHRARSPQFSMPHAPIKRFNETKIESTPGPGAYQVGPAVRKAPKWAAKLRVPPASKTRLPVILLKSWDLAKATV
jgi:hypothetical protein